MKHQTAIVAYAVSQIVNDALQFRPGKWGWLAAVILQTKHDVRDIELARRGVVRARLSRRRLWFVWGSLARAFRDDDRVGEKERRDNDPMGSERCRGRHGERSEENRDGGGQL